MLFFLEDSRFGAFMNQRLDLFLGYRGLERGAKPKGIEESINCTASRARAPAVPGGRAP